jgi:hypothetical protein
MTLEASMNADTYSQSPEHPPAVLQVLEEDKSSKCDRAMRFGVVQTIGNEMLQLDLRIQRW